LSSIIQAQIADDCDRYDEDIKDDDPQLPLYPNFDLLYSSLSPEFGGDIEDPETIAGLENILNHEIIDEELKNKIVCHRVPPLLSIFRYC
jgi:hypothetical protein